MPWGLHPLVARGAQGVLETDCQAVPTLLDSRPDAVHVEDMLALQLNHWLFTQALDVADCTKRVCILLKSLFIIFSYTLFMQTRRVFLFTIIPIAIMIAL